MERIAFSDQTKEATLKAQKAKGLFLIEEQRHVDGNFLLFDSSPQKETVSELQALKNRITVLEAKVTALERG